MVTIVVVEGRRMMRLAGELAPEVFDALLEEYQRLLRQVLESMGGHDVDIASDTAVAAFETAKEAALAAGAAQRAVTAQAWPHGSRLAISIGLHSVEALVGSAGPALRRANELCDAAEGGQIFLTPEASSLLEEEDLVDLTVRDLGEVPLRRSEQRVRAYELVVPAAAH
jgi:class 3 adenylate cyclase